MTFFKRLPTRAHHFLIKGKIQSFQGKKLLRILKTGILLSILLLQFPLIIPNIIPSVLANSNDDSIPTMGEQSIIVLLVEFKDVHHGKSKKDISKAIFQNLNKYITEISYKVGYKDISSFTFNFKKISGQSPSEFKKDH